MSVPSQEPTPEVTGRSVVVFSDDARGKRDAILAALQSLAEVTNLIESSDADHATLRAGGLAASDAITFGALGLAVVARKPDELAAALERTQASSSSISAVEPERVLHAIVVEEPEATADFTDDDEFTWGLRATGVDTTQATGEGIKLAVLDTGFEADHPDFAGRTVTTKSFIDGETADDGHGHGTHCIGTSSGPAKPAEGRRYGVAPGVEVFAGKVLNNEGSGEDAGILAGIEWAISNGCRVISMSLGADVREPSATYEAVGRRALEAGTLIVAAAGNNANRPGDPGFVGIPANSVSIMAVAALDSSLEIAEFSAGSGAGEGAAVDIAGPGVDVYSTWLMPERYNTISGTSMATPHVAGLAALWSQTSGDSGQALWTTVVGAARKLELPASDVGAGLAQAPKAPTD
jgi:subtilisin family serine protease